VGQRDRRRSLGGENRERAIRRTSPRGASVTRTGPDARAVPRTFDGGDGLRAIAALFVLVFHVAYLSLASKGLPVAGDGEATIGQFRPIFGALAPEFVSMRAGIYIFFALSGYLLSRPFLAAYLIGTPQPSVSRYFRNRALRIIPAFWVVTTVYLVWHGLPPGADLGGLAAVYGFAQNYYATPAVHLIGQAWTLDIEVAFYIALPVVTLLAFGADRRRIIDPSRRLVLLLALLLLAYAASLVVRQRGGIQVQTGLNLTYNLADFLFAFIPGIALAAIEPFAAPRLRAADTRVGRAWWRGLLGVSLALLGLFVSLPASDYGMRRILITLACGALLGALLVLQWSTGRCSRALDNRAMRWLGERSYGIYLIHFGLIAHVLSRVGPAHGLKTTYVLTLAGVTAATLIAADVLWRVVERPALQRRLPWRDAEFATPVPAPAGVAGG
jgi:peptidoglycan/LPS O-acetylase OafA/YrhL